MPKSLVTAEFRSLFQMLIQIIRTVDFHSACRKAGLHEGSVCVCVGLMVKQGVYVPDRQTGNRPLVTTERRAE